MTTQNPTDWRLVERAAAQRERGLKCELSWPQISELARQLAEDSGEDELQLGAAARALDGFALFGTSGGDAAREAGVWAAAAFAAGGNFPTSGVVLRRTFPRLGGRGKKSRISFGRARFGSWDGAL